MTYSSVSTNSFEQYGECLMGTRGTMIVEAEQRVMLFTEKDPTTKDRTPARMMSVDVSKLTPGGSAAESTSTWGGATAAPVGTLAGPGAAGGPVSRGYREEMEDFAYCVRLLGGKKFDYSARDDSGHYQGRLPRCHGEVAMADAIVALTANKAMHSQQRVKFEATWFDSDSDKVPDDPREKPREMKKARAAEE
jgi:hypothetical protein